MGLLSNRINLNFMTNIKTRFFSNKLVYDNAVHQKQCTRLCYVYVNNPNAILVTIIIMMMILLQSIRKNFPTHITSIAI